MSACCRVVVLISLALGLAFAVGASGEELPAGMKRLLERLPPADQQFLGGAKYCGSHAMSQLVTYSTENARLRAVFHLPPALLRELPAGGEPVLLTLEGSPHLWSIHRRKSGTLDEGLSMMILTCWAPEIAWPFNRFSIASDGQAVMVTAAQMFGPPNFQPYLTLNQGEHALHLSWRIEENKYVPKRADVLDVTMLAQRVPELYDKYLIPALRRLGPARPSSDIYRMFDQIPADPAATQRVVVLVQKLDSSDSAVRESVLKSIMEQGRPAILATLRLNRATLSPEQVARLAAFHESEGWIHVADLDAAKNDEAFLSACLEDEDKAVQTAASNTLAALRAMRGLR